MKIEQEHLSSYEINNQINMITHVYTCHMHENLKVEEITSAMTERLVPPFSISYQYSISMEKKQQQPVECCILLNASGNNVTVKTQIFATNILRKQSRLKHAYSFIINVFRKIM